MTAQHYIFQNRHIAEQLHGLECPGDTPFRNLVSLEMLDGQSFEYY